MSHRGPEWFAAKSFGYGSGWPIAWQGWVLLLIFMTVIGTAIWFFQERLSMLLSIIVPATSVFLMIAARTTRGGWRWRSGGRD